MGEGGEGKKINKDSDSSSHKMMDGAKGSPIISLFFLSESLQVNKKKKNPEEWMRTS